MSSQPIILQLGKNQSITIPVKVRSVNGQVGDVVLDAADVGAVAIDNVGDGKLMNYVTLTYDGDNVTMTKSFVNVNNGSEYELSETVLLANDTTAGLMSPADVVTLELHTNQIAALQGQTVRLLYTDSTTPTEPEIAQFVTDSGYTTDLQNIAVVVSQTFHIWHWYTNTQIWQDDGVDTVSQFTNSTPGTIMGAAVAGKVYAESDGTGSVFGWDDLMTDIENAVTDAENAADDAQDDADAAAASATLAESWAVGGTNTRAGEDTDNASYYAGLASDNASDAMGYASAASTSATNAQKWADGTGAASGDPQYQNNAKYYAEQTAASLLYALPCKEIVNTTTLGADNIPIKALSISILGSQSGTGTPAPDNVRTLNSYATATLTAPNGDTAQFAVMNDDMIFRQFNAVYDAVSKKLTSHQIVRTFVDNSNWVQVNEGQYYVAVSTNFREVSYTAPSNTYGAAEWMPIADYSDNRVLGFRVNTNGSTRRFTVYGADNISGVSDLASWKQYLSTHPLTVMLTYINDYETTIDDNPSLESLDIRTSLGNNTFSADCGDVTATIRLDPTLAFDYLLNN